MVLVTATEEEFLLSRGWLLRDQPFDLCWLDCAHSGWLRTWRPDGAKALCICLCLEHALCLEQGVYGGDYTGAPLPAESLADEWPWRYCSEVNI